MSEMNELRALADEGDLDATGLRRLDELMADRNERVSDAVDALEGIWEALAQVAGHFSCGEIEILLDVLAAAGMTRLEEVVRWHHAQADDDPEDYASHRALIGTDAPR